MTLQTRERTSTDNQEHGDTIVGSAAESASVQRLSMLHLSFVGTRLLGLEQEDPHTCLLLFTQFCFPMFPCAP